MQRNLFLIVFLTLLSLKALAHCPGHFPKEKVCFMLDQNRLFIYDHKIEHDGPYKDLVRFRIESVHVGPKKVELKKVARGIYQLISSAPVPIVELKLSHQKETFFLKIKSEK